MGGRVPVLGGGKFLLAPVSQYIFTRGFRPTDAPASPVALLPRAFTTRAYTPAFITRARTPAHAHAHHARARVRTGTRTCTGTHTRTYTRLPAWVPARAYSALFAIHPLPFFVVPSLPFLSASLPFPSLPGTFLHFLLHFLPSFLLHSALSCTTLLHSARLSGTYTPGRLPRKSFGPFLAEPFLTPFRDTLMG